MLAIVPRNNSTIESELLRDFRLLSENGRVRSGASPGHHDGWGVVVWLGGQPSYLCREPTDAGTDPKFDLLCDKLDEMRLSSHLILHLRKASRGSKTKENTHPFVIDRWAFAHNGTIHIPGLGDKTDSQRFFEMLMVGRKKGNGDMTNALVDQVSSAREKYDYTSITFLLSNGSDLYAYRDYKKFGDYYTMYYTALNDAFVVSQEKFFESDWHEVDNRQLLHVSDSDFDLRDMT